MRPMLYVLRTSFLPLDCVFSVDSYHIFATVVSAYNEHFYPEFVLDQDCGRYWLSPEGVVDVGFTIDRGCERPFNQILLRNSLNGTSGPGQVAG